MIRTTMLAVSALLITPVPAAAQSQADLDARYDRALAAGYKALFLCSAIATAEAHGGARAPGHVIEWELTGVYPTLDPVIRELDYRLFRANNGMGVLSYVEVDWAAEMPPRLAWHEEAGGCTLGPVGMIAPPEREGLPFVGPDGIIMWNMRIPPSKLGAVADRAFSADYGTDARTTALVFAHGAGDGFYWQYANDFDPFTPQRTWSVAKSVAATLAGAAVQRGEADVSASAGLGEDDSDPRRAITVDQLLRMSSGLYSDTPGNRTDPLYIGGATVDEVALDWPLLDPPGSTFRYANNDILAAVRAIEQTFADHPPAELFAQLGMHHTVAETDWQGNYILSSQVWSTAGDLARLGQLYLNDGLLPDGTRILPEGWVEYVSTPSGPQPEGRNWGYGAGWWLLNKSEGIPSDTILAAGNRGQYIVVIPSLDVVIVRRGEDPAGGSGFDIEAFTRDILAALDD